MESIIVCNTAADTISKIDLSDNSVKHLPLDLGEKPVGPHGIHVNEDTLITANNYNNSISIVNLKTFKEMDSIYVGAHPNDVKTYKNKAYIACGESNSLVIYDFAEGKISLEIKIDACPHSIAIDELRGLVFVSNMNGHSISIIECESDKVIERIKAPEYPTKIMISKDKKKIYLCESYLGYGIEGYVSIIDINNTKLVNRVKVGITPVDMFEEDGKLYVTNFEEGSISIIDVSKGREIKKIFVGGMPRGIIKYEEKLYIGDYLNGKIRVLDLKERKIKNIATGSEPNAMSLVYLHH